MLIKHDKADILYSKDFDPWKEVKELLELYGTAIMGARKAAENAIHLCRVDEQVNKAVLGANGAATAARVAAVKVVQNRVDGKFCDTDI
ncbi:hypothetical protein Q3G72_035422 [Acer saccharum]|nr:hypothetical protein Q3G72_035422 [Acer saccharum]